MFVSILQYRCTTRTMNKHVEKKLDGNCTRMLRTILNKCWKQHSTKQQLYSHQPSISKIIQIRRAKHAGHCWRRKDKHISDVLLWTSTQPLTSHLTHRPNKTNKTCRTLLEKQRRIYKRRSPMDPYTATYLPSHTPSK